MVGKEDKAKDIYSKNLPTFENKLVYCKFISKYANDYELAAGYEDAADIIFNNKNIDELKQLIKDNPGDDDYSVGFRTAIKDYIKERGENID